MSSSVKCPQCGLVNFSSDEKCKRCEADLSQSAQVIQQSAAQQAQRSRNPNLTPCPDCGQMISQQAGACPSCGRHIRTFDVTVSRTGWTGTIAWGILLSGVLLVAINIIVFIVLLMFFGVLAGASRATP